MTFVPIEMAIEVRKCKLEIFDQDGKVACSPPYPLRVGVMLAKQSNAAKYVEEYARELRQVLDNKTAKDKEIQIGDLNDCQDVVMKELIITDYSGGCINFSFKLREAGDYFVFASINEKAVGSHTKISIVDNPNGEPAMDDLEAEYQKAMEAEQEEEEQEEKEKERQFLEMKRKQQEDEMRRAEEELRQKTKERAEQNLKQHLMDKKVREMRDIQAKKDRADLRVGGGFDLDKYTNLRKSDRQKEITKDQAKAIIAEKNRKDTLKSRDLDRASSMLDGYSEVPEPISRAPERQLSQYEGINLSEYNDVEIEQGDLQSPYVNLQGNIRPGSGYKLRPVVMRGSRPSSRMADDKNFIQNAGLDPRLSMPGGSFVESQLFSRNETSDTMRKQPVKAMVKTGDQFFPGQDKIAPELTESRDLRDSKGFGHVKEKLNHAMNFERQSTGHSQTRDAINSSQSNRKSFKIASSSSKPLRRGMSTEKAKIESLMNDDKTAPKKTKGGLSQQRKPDINRMPLIGATGPKIGSLNSQGLKLKKR